MLAWFAVLGIVFVAYCYHLLRHDCPSALLSTELVGQLATIQPVADEVVAAIDGMLRGTESAKKRMVYLTVLGLLEDRGLTTSDRAVALAVEIAWLRHRPWFVSPAWGADRMDDAH